MALPGTNKSFDQFRADDMDCRQYASNQVGGDTAERAQADSALKSAVNSGAVKASAVARAIGVIDRPTKKHTIEGGYLFVVRGEGYTFGAAPVAAYPEVPSFKSQGYDVEYTAWAGLVAPKGTPPHVIKILRDAVRQEPMERPSGSEQMLLAGEFGQRPRPHAIRKRTIAGGRRIDR